MNDRYIYINLEYAIRIHDKIIEETGGLKGIKSEGLLESTLCHIQNNDYYPTFEEKILYLIFSIAKNHIFLDGNKRTSLLLASYFLIINGYPEWIVGEFINKMEDIILLLVENIITREECGEFIALIISENPFPESLQLRLFEALMELKRREKERNLYP